MMNEGQERLIGAYEIRLLNDGEFATLFQKHYPQVFESAFEFDPQQVLSEDERLAIQVLRQRLKGAYRLNVGVYCGGEFVGWSCGVQETAERFYMVNSGILPEHQNRGIYSALLLWILKSLRKEGFQIAYSRHVATSNRILVTKLKAGFVITGFELSDRFGALVRLSYFFNRSRRNVLDIRSGETTPDAVLRNALRLQ